MFHIWKPLTWLLVLMSISLSLYVCFLIMSEKTILFVLDLHQPMITWPWNKLKLIVDPCAGCSGVAQILLYQRMHDHIYCICTEILLSARQTLPSVPFQTSCINRHSIWYKEPVLFLALSLADHWKWNDNELIRGGTAEYRIKIKKEMNCHSKLQSNSIS